MHTDVIQDVTGAATRPSTNTVKPTTLNTGNAYSHFKVIRRNGKTTEFSPEKIKVAITKAFLEVEGGNAAVSSRIHLVVDNLTDQICQGPLPVD